MRVVTKRTSRDRQELVQRLAKIDLDSYKQMYSKLKGISKEKLQNRAKEIVENHPSLEKPDRLALRQRPAFICWFCEHDPMIQEYEQSLKTDDSEVFNSELEDLIDIDDWPLELSDESYSDF
jgi:hypothetical protein